MTTTTIYSIVLRKHGLMNEIQEVYFYFLSEKLINISFLYSLEAASKKPQCDHQLWNIHDCVADTVLPCSNSLL